MKATKSSNGNGANTGTVYLIHFDTPLKHARHYLGFTTDFVSRMEAHQCGDGSRLMEVVTDSGIDWACVRTWDGVTRGFERRLKNQKNTGRLCPCCNGQKALDYERV